MMRWGENETYQFVKIYLSHNSLWNSNHESYKLKHERQKAYQTIIEEFMSCTGIKLNESEVKIKIKNLRSTYTQEITKIRTRSRPNSQYKPTIKWFADWHRCFNHNSKKTEIDDAVYHEHTNDSDNKPWVTNNLNHANEDSVDPFESQTQDCGFQTKCIPVTSSNNRVHSSYKKRRKKIKLLSTTKKCDRISRNSSLTSTADDEFDLYGHYIASQLRQMDLQKALRLQLEIQTLMREVRVAEISTLH